MYTDAVPLPPIVAVIRRRGNPGVPKAMVQNRKCILYLQFSIV